jgi:hypothetical protein
LKRQLAQIGFSLHHGTSFGAGATHPTLDKSGRTAA